MKYYFDSMDGEACYPKDYFEEQLGKDLTEMKLYPAKMIKGELVAWCSIWGEPFETQRGDCGKDCDKYKPRNGKNGRCKFSKNCYEPINEPITINP